VFEQIQQAIVAYRLAVESGVSKARTPFVLCALQVKSQLDSLKRKIM
jgi:hypothetical protein